MKIIYRACPMTNPHKVPAIKPKAKLVSKCFHSLKEAFSDVDYDLTVLLDKPNEEFRSIFKGENVEESFYSSFNEGNAGTFHRQIDIALEAKDDFFFIEDDYYFLPGSGKIISEAIKQFPFITPYDHPGYYNDGIHEYKRDIQFSSGRHWQTVKSTTLTFAGQYEYLREEASTMKGYGLADHPMWSDITGRTALWSPIPTLATHMETPHLSPGVDWKFENLN